MPGQDPAGLLPAPVEAQPAATVVLLRPGPGGPEVLLTERPMTMAFAAGIHVFPGGRVDATDADPRLANRSSRSAADAARALGDNIPAAPALAVHMAALRELFEEAGVLLADGDLEPRDLTAARERLLGGDGLGPAIADLGGRLRTDRLAPIAHWTTPSFMKRRFSTWFFVADLPPGMEPTFAAGEVVGHRWLTPAAALDQLAAGEIEMWVPTTSVLERLIETGATTAGDIAARLAFGRSMSPRIVEEGPALVRLTFGAVGAVPGRTGSASLHGQREFVLVDPGDPSEAAIATISAVVDERGGTIRAIVLTAPDPDHAAAAEAVAIPREIPILVAPGAGRHLPYATREVADGERLPTDVELRVALGPPGSGRLEVVSASARE